MSLASTPLATDLPACHDFSRPANVGDVLLLAARHHPLSGVRMISADRHKTSTFTSYPALLTESRRILGGLRVQGHPSGANVVLVLERPADFIPAFWACFLGGYVPCPLAPIRNDPARWSRHLAHVMALLDAPLLVTTAELRIELPDGTQSVDLDALRASAREDTVHHAASDDPAILMLTSGSTGNSKAVVLTHCNLLASISSRAERQQLSSKDVMFNWIAYDHVAALLESHMTSVYVGATHVNADPASVLADPLRFLRIVESHSVTVAFAPNFLLGQINAALRTASSNTHGGLPEFKLTSLRRIVTGGEANVVETGVRFLNLLAASGLSPDVLWPAFGMTETCAAAVYSDDFPGCEADREFAAVGHPIRGLEVRIVDERGGRLPAGQAGELQLRGPMIFTRYYDNDAATRSAFTEDGWLRTGDLGCLEHGRLRLVGRSKDCIIVSGVNYFSQELEAAVERLEGIQRAFVAAFPVRPKGADTEQLVVAFAPLFPLDNEVELHRLVAAIRNTTIMLWGFRPALILPLPKTAFPKTSLGKIQRSLLRRRLETGELTAHERYVAEVTQRQLGGYVPPDGPLETAIVQIFADIFQVDPGTVSAAASFFDLGGTSLDIIKLRRRLSEHARLPDVPMIRILQNPTARALGRRGSEQYDPIVTLQATGSKIPLFCVHPATGEVLVFVSLASYFVQDRPFFALRARGLSAGERPFASIDEMVLSYVDAIRKKQPSGPYAIAGYSFGGAIAFEIAKRLEAQGERVAFCGSIDGTVFIGDRGHKLNWAESAFRVAYFLGLVDMDQMLKLPAEMLAQVPVPDIHEAIIRLAAPERLAQLDLDLPKFRAWADLSYTLVSMGQEYVPSGDIESVTVFCADPLWGTKEEWLRNDLSAWKLHTRTAPRYVDVSGTHSSLLEREHVSSFQAVLCKELGRALGDS